MDAYFILISMYVFGEQDTSALVFNRELGMFVLIYVGSYVYHLNLVGYRFFTSIINGK